MFINILITCLLILIISGIFTIYDNNRKESFKQYNYNNNNIENKDICNDNCSKKIKVVNDDVKYIEEKMKKIDEYIQKQQLDTFKKNDL
jgi:hypothetical protein